MISHVHKIAVIDIGSNSVRMVVYDGLKRAPLPLFNEKKMCALARDMEKTGKLYAQGRVLAETAIRRFVALIRAMEVDTIYALATSAVRDASDGAEFARNLEKEYGIPVRILTGEEEAKFAGFGVISSFYHAEGIVGDLGGGSLELIPVSHDTVSSGQSFPIGPLRLKSSKKSVPPVDIIDSYLGTLPLLQRLKGKNFYAVGGGLRTLAKIHMSKERYPLKILHEYQIKAEDFLPTLKAVSTLSPSRIKQMSPEAGKRAETLALAALVAERIIEIGKPSHIVFSVHGIREGFLYDMLEGAEQKEDALQSACADMIRHISPDNTETWHEYGIELHRWMQPPFVSESADESRLRLAACILLRLSWYEHVEYRGEMAFRWVLDAALTSLTHAERLFVAFAVFHRYHSKADAKLYKLARGILSPESVAKARIIGLAMRLGYNISGGGRNVLKDTPIETKDGTLLLHMKKHRETLSGEAVEKRMQKLAEVIGVAGVVR